jgi:heavy metal sensor kinase
MRSKNRTKIRQTLAFRLTLWYGGIFTVSTLVAFFLFYLMILSAFRERTDRDLASQAEQMATILRVRGLDAAKSLAVLEAQAAGVKKIFIRLLYPSGEVFSSSNMSYWENIRVSREAIHRLLESRKAVFHTISISDRKDRVRILYTALGPSVILQLGQSMEWDTRFVEAFRRTFALAMALVIFFSAMAGWFMARRALAGVEAITRTARQIIGGDLKNRVPVRSRAHELDQLALTFNRMLDQIELLIAGIREMNDNIAHDLKSPITRIRGIAEVTLATARMPGEYEAMAASILEECDRLLDMINTMLMISRTEAGGEGQTPQPMDLSGIVRDACALFRPMAEEKGLTLSCRTPGQAPFSGDIRKIQRMIADLLDNAVKYTPAGGRVAVSLESGEGDRLEISISDTGIGISPEDFPHVFERFYRCDASRSQSGFGLGLSLARAVARFHGGDIQVRSIPGKGSVFTVSLPNMTKM